tara:strand:- start:119 stop:265 length:147 start_codon:yes stop_codon:yes gene_type:complete
MLPILSKELLSPLILERAEIFKIVKTKNKNKNIGKIVNKEILLKIKKI